MVVVGIEKYENVNFEKYNLIEICKRYKEKLDNILEEFKKFIDKGFKFMIILDQFSYNRLIYLNGVVESNRILKQNIDYFDATYKDILITIDPCLEENNKHFYCMVFDPNKSYI